VSLDDVSAQGGCFDRAARRHVDRGCPLPPAQVSTCFSVFRPSRRPERTAGAPRPLSNHNRSNRDRVVRARLGGDNGPSDDQAGRVADFFLVQPRPSSFDASGEHDSAILTRQPLFLAEEHGQPVFVVCRSPLTLAFIRRARCGRGAGQPAPSVGISGATHHRRRPTGTRKSSSGATIPLLPLPRPAQPPTSFGSPHPLRCSHARPPLGHRRPSHRHRLSPGALESAGSSKALPDAALC